MAAACIPWYHDSCSLLRQISKQNVWITCEGENNNDLENIGKVNYYPHPGMPTYFYPFRNQPGYQSPLVAVEFASVKSESPAPPPVVSSPLTALPPSVPNDPPLLGLCRDLMCPFEARKADLGRSETRLAGDRGRHRAGTASRRCRRCGDGRPPARGTSPGSPMRAVPAVAGADLAANDVRWHAR